MKAIYTVLHNKMKKSITNKEFSNIIPIVIGASEAQRIVLRMNILDMLIKGHSYSEIENTTGASSKTIALIASFLETTKK